MVHYLQFAKRAVKKSKFGSYLFAVFPKRLLYTKDYIEVRKLHKLDGNVKDSEVLDHILRQKMTKVLREALLYVPWYRMNVSIDADSITIDNVYDKLAQFPYTNKKLIMENWDKFINEKYPRSSLKIGSTEGTTGQGILIANIHREVGSQIAFFEHSVKAFKFDFIKTRTIRIGLEALQDISNQPCKIYGNRLLISPVHLIPQWFSLIYSKCNEFNALVIHSYPTLLFLLAQYINDNQLKPIKVKTLLLSSDVYLYHHYIAFKQAFDNPEIVCTYNMSEHVAFGVSFVNEMEKSIGYQLNRIYAYNENLKDEFERHEIIGTSYWNYAMPFIRYQTQDYGKIDKALIINKLDGRGQTFLTTKQGNKIAGISMLSPEDYIWNYIEAFQFVQKEPGKIIIKLVPKKNVFNNGIGDRILFDMEASWPNLFDYSIEVVDQIQRGRSTKIQSIIVDINV